MRKPQVPAARNTLAILKLLSTIDVPVSASRIRTELSLPRSTTYHLLAELVEAGFVVHIPENQTYGLGLAAYAMASAYSTQQPLVRLVTKDLEKIALNVGGSGHLSRMAGTEVVYLQEVRAPGAVSLVTEVGVRLQAHKTASGRAMLSLLPESEVRAAFGAGSGWQAMKQHLAQVAERGWDSEDEEVSRGQASLAVPIVDHVGRPAAAVAVTYPVGKPTEAARQAALTSLQALAARVGQKMYGHKAGARAPLR
ncbi:IclR family transcriptional regulator [Corynebacterium lizhenjunii]|uniref:IclR family transcriptional regulator n=1 Tax=Corynebacterium lizhenjunii TaxID=2709394 RepID=A0A7T0KHS2_9CORY|nr:IclR family transcriptional regulator [Corynebacterium lizhenjunii]QPK79953.1 IclR family transcriptional regulator [Corynebacterium lizhenjunii]